MKTTKKKSSYNQIVAALGHYESGELDSAITLAAAAEGMLSANDDRYLFHQLQASGKAADIDQNQVINWLKHTSGSDPVNISQFEAAMAIARSITKFVAAHHQSTERFEIFLRQVYEDGILPVKLYKDSN